MTKRVRQAKTLGDRDTQPAFEVLQQVRGNGARDQTNGSFEADQREGHDREERAEFAK